MLMQASPFMGSRGNPSSRRPAIIVILSAVSIGLLLQGMVWRIEGVGVDWIAAILGLAVSCSWPGCSCSMSFAIPGNVNRVP
jgi:hypothetical protein